MLMDFYGYVISPLLGLIVWAMIISAILSWLVAFNVVNGRNQFIATVQNVTDMVTRPLLAPLRRVIPPLGGQIDITPVILILLIEFCRRSLFPQLIGMIS
jgi:YggT family protein